MLVYLEYRLILTYVICCVWHQEKRLVGAGKVYLWCNEKGKDAQGHMLDVGHCERLQEGDVNFKYADFT